jgi:hypothetical protein
MVFLQQLTELLFVCSASKKQEIQPFSKFHDMDGTHTRRLALFWRLVGAVGQKGARSYCEAEE